MTERSRPELGEQEPLAPSVVGALPRRGGGPFYRLRVGVLLAVLGGVLIYAGYDYRERHARRKWQRPLEVALVLLGRGPLDEPALGAFVERLPALESALAREFARYGGSFPPIRFRRFGPVPERERPPATASEPGLFEPLRLSYALWHFARASDAASGLRDADGPAFDGKIYVVLSAPASSRRALVEGLGQDGGRIAVTNIELSEDSVDFGLFVVTHELFHLLGAADRYGPDGTTLVPDGLGEPDLEPLYPQSTAEVMARGQVLGPGREVAPSDLDGLRVGRRTAVEIGWLAQATP